MLLGADKVLVLQVEVLTIKLGKIMNRILDIIEVEEVYKVVEEGITVPVICRLCNGMDVVVKYKNNPYGSQVLANELIGSLIADTIGLTIPRFGICNLSEDVIRQTNSNYEIDEANAGLAFFSEYISKGIPLNSAVLSFVKNKETAKLLLFDHIINNQDRHIGNMLLEIDKTARLYAIDHSHIFTKHYPSTVETLQKEMSHDYLIKPDILQSNKEVYDVLCNWVSYSENDMRKETAHIKHILTQKKIKEIKEAIPRAWKVSLGSDIMDCIIESLVFRINGIDDICEMIIDERRK